MKKVFALLLTSILSVSIWAQTPQSIRYQAVARDNSGNVLSNQAVSFRISILFGSVSGNITYRETHTGLSTNAFGLAELEIGKGTPVNGTFSAIDWSMNSYFVQVEMDPAGGKSYQELSTSQLLSVPYALHAKTAENITGTITESDPIFTDSRAAFLKESDITNLGNLSGTNTGDQDLSTLATKAALDDSIAFLNNKIPSTLTIGQSYQGGIIFWLDATGQHGLIVATTDQSTGIQWYNGTNTRTNAVRDGIGAGMFNTERIILNQGVGAYAAQLCANYQNGGYGDWYLPSKYELNLLFAQKTVVGGIASAYYWSSSESTQATTAWVQYIGGSGLQQTFPKSNTHYVRAIRAF